MKHHIIAASLLCLVSTAHAADSASHSFVWAGSVPTVGISNSWVIANPQGGPIDQGGMVFSTDADGTVHLTSSTSLSFNVFTENADTGAPATPLAPAGSYSYKLVELKAGNGFPIPQPPSGGFYSVSANGAPMVEGTSVTGHSGITNLAIVEATSNAPNKPAPGDNVVLHAVIMVEDAAA